VRFLRPGHAIEHGHAEPPRLPFHSPLLQHCLTPTRRAAPGPGLRGVVAATVHSPGPWIGPTIG
jgi:hypothetical protein